MLNLCNSSVTNATFKQVTVTSLESLNVCGTKIGFQGLLDTNTISQLEWLSIDLDQIGDVSPDTFASAMPKLTHLNLHCESNVVEDAEGFKSKLPNEWNVTIKAIAESGGSMCEDENEEKKEEENKREMEEVRVEDDQIIHPD